MIDITTLSNFLDSVRDLSFESGNVDNRTKTPSAVLSQQSDNSTGNHVPPFNDTSLKCHDSSDKSLLTTNKKTKFDPPKPEPNYVISFMRDVGRKETSFAPDTIVPFDDTHIVIKIHFPGSTLEQLKLEVSSNQLVASSNYE
jgi:hypothetical protein